MVKYLMFCVCVAAGYIMYSSFPIIHGAGVTAEEPPSIKPITWQEPFTFKGATLTPKKQVEGTVRILDKKRYFIDAFSRFSPSDVMVGWNEMSDEQNIDYIYHSLSNRGFETKHPKAPIEEQRISQESDLWHLIPSTSVINDRIRQLRVGHIVEVKGLIVDINHPSGFKFTTDISSSKQRQHGLAVWIESFEIR